MGDSLFFPGVRIHTTRHRYTGNWMKLKLGHEIHPYRHHVTWHPRGIHYEFPSRNFSRSRERTRRFHRKVGLRARLMIHRDNYFPNDITILPSLIMKRLSG